MKLQGQLSACCALNMFSAMGTSHMEERLSQNRRMGFFAKQGQLKHVVNW